MNKQWIMIHLDKFPTLLLIEEGIFFVFSSSTFIINLFVIFIQIALHFFPSVQLYNKKDRKGFET
ncbi:hypothetical protein C6W26_05770 [Bacillus halotolerans]|nr:hypothetical protein C6W26_05770 [Bacillus halotolerans]